MMQKCAIIFFATLVIGRISVALEYNKQNRYNPNTDFLLHEGGVNSYNPSKNQAVNANVANINTFQNPNKNNYDAQFPALGGAAPTSQTTSTSSTNSRPHNGPQSSNSKRDYVAPQYTTVKPAQNNNQLPVKNVATLPPSQFPTLKPVQPTQPGKLRDYVAPQFPTQNPTHRDQQSTGKVKNLINFYDNQNKGQNTPQKVPSYSNVVQGNSNRNEPNVVTSTTKKETQVSTPSNLKPSTPVTPKPLSFSSVVAGSNKPGIGTTPKPSTRVPPNSSTRPGSPVLPSAIANNNRGNTNGDKPTDAELQTLSEELLRKDVNNAAKYITINYQERTTSQSKEDKAPRPLLAVSPEAWNIPTIQKLVPLLDNYERDTLVNEYVTPQERNEENAFMDEIMSTSVMRHLMTFLKNKGYVTPDPRQQRDFVKQLWFSLYSRGKGKISSSGFEHVFLSEQRSGDVLGLHNWVYFAKEEAANRVNYLGYMKYSELNDKGAVLLIHFNYQGADKPVNSIFIGTSPELEIALYTLCFVTRSDDDCKLKLANKDIDITTHIFRYRSKNLIGSAYPSIRN